MHRRGLRASAAERIPPSRAAGPIGSAASPLPPPSTLGSVTRRLRQVFNARTSASSDNPIVPEDIPPITRRVAGFAIDYAVLQFVWWMAIVPATGRHASSYWWIWFSFALTYLAVPTARYGATLGKRAAGTQVLTRLTGQRLSVGTSLVRAGVQLAIILTANTVGPLLASVAVYLCAYTGVWLRPWRRGLDDLAASSIVVFRA